MALLNITKVFKSLDYNISKQIFWTLHCFISGISDMVALMEVKTENYKTEFKMKISEAITTSLSCGHMRKKGGIVI